ncbi:RNA demethylase ALKBH9B [Linum grandiflorum]
MSDNGGKIDDPFLHQYQPADLRIASEFLNTWLPFLSKGLCNGCSQSLSDRIRSLDPKFNGSPEQLRLEETPVSPIAESCEHVVEDHNDEDFDKNSLGSWNDGAHGSSDSVPGDTARGLLGPPPGSETSGNRMSWADMAQQEDDELGDEDENLRSSVLGGVGSSPLIAKAVEKPQLSREKREYLRFMNVQRKKDFICFERVHGKLVNILEGLELHSGVFSAAEQKRIVDHVFELKETGMKGGFKARTLTAPQKWMRGKGRVTLQFGCCYNYATDKKGNPPGILKNEMVDPIPHLFKVIIRRLIAWHVLPPTCVPDSCIVNIYDEGDCIPPHIDNHDFLRPFCTVSFVSECNIVFGTNLKIVGPGDFSGPVAIPLPVGSVLVLNGNGADIAKHCVPSVPTKRISITFRKMDGKKWPAGFVPEPDLQGIQPLEFEADKTNRSNSPKSEPYRRRQQPLETEGNKMDFRRAVFSEPRYPNRGRGRGRGSQGPRLKVNAEI